MSDSDSDDEDSAHGGGPRYPKSLNATAVPRGVAPGCLSPDNALYACVPSSLIGDMYESTLPHRRKDLVFLCNFVPSRHLVFGGDSGDDSDDILVTELHLAVPHAASKDSVERPPLVLGPKLDSSPASPPAVVHRRHARALVDLLRREGIPVHRAHL